MILTVLLFERKFVLNLSEHFRFFFFFPLFLGKHASILEPLGLEQKKTHNTAPIKFLRYKLLSNAHFACGLNEIGH